MELEDLGISKAGLAQRIIDGIVEQEMDPDSDLSQRVHRGVKEKIQEQIDKRVQEIADQYVLPAVNEMIETICLQRTNEWGDAKGDGLTFREYLVKRADFYLTEPVDYNGKSKKESRDGYGWKGDQGRISHIVDKYLSTEIENAMKDAVAGVDKSIADGISETIRIKMKELSEKLTITVGRGR